MNLFKNVPVVEILTVIAIVAIVFILVVGTVIDTRPTQDQYNAWCKLHHRSDITFEEWKVLKQGNWLDTYSPQPCTPLEQP